MYISICQVAWKGDDIRFPFCNPRSSTRLSNLQQILSRAHTLANSRFCEKEKERGRKKKKKKRMTVREKKKREASGNASNSDDVNAHQSVIRHRPSLRFVYFLRKALVQHVAATACEWHVCIQRCASSSLLRPSLRSFIHGGWSLATRVCT